MFSNTLIMVFYMKKTESIIIARGAGLFNSALKHHKLDFNQYCYRQQNSTGMLLKTNGYLI